MYLVFILASLYMVPKCGLGKNVSPSLNLAHLSHTIESRGG